MEVFLGAIRLSSLTLICAVDGRLGGAGQGRAPRGRVVVA
jgi:hypothetical protein